MAHLAGVRINSLRIITLHVHCKDRLGSEVELSCLKAQVCYHLRCRGGARSRRQISVFRWLPYTGSGWNQGRVATPATFKEREDARFKMAVSPSALVTIADSILEMLVIAPHGVQACWEHHSLSTQHATSLRKALQIGRRESVSCSESGLPTSGICKPWKPRRRPSGKLEPCHGKPPQTPFPVQRLLTCPRGL